MSEILLESTGETAHISAKETLELELQEYIESVLTDRGGKNILNRGNSMCKYKEV